MQLSCLPGRLRLWLLNNIWALVYLMLLRIFAPMKIFKLILSLYILTLSCFPCGDVRECNDQAELEISAASEHKDHAHTTEACTPFCTCSCCAASTVFQYSAAIVNTQKVVFASLKYPGYKISDRPEVSFTIWQPPKIA